MSFADKTVVVVGAGAGMGEAAALEYARRSAKVFVVDIDRAAADRTVEAIRVAGGTAQPHEADLRKADDMSGMVSAAVAHYGGLDVLANIGAIYPAAPLETVTEEFWDDMFAVDLKGPLFACQAALPYLKNSRGTIVNVASGAAFYPIPGLAAYSAAKAGLAALSRSVALEAGPSVRVNTIVPGPTVTQGSPAHLQLSVPLWDRPLTPQELANVIVWVTSDAASAVNGALLRVDGGHHML